ncbi:MAG TPA: hypothetical protein VH107_10345, partial [Lacipirellulaceae bacterium]|nr:hypothetical protein [Lacipirellulaceae bacterium]
IDRPFRIPLYPLPVLIFCATCVYMLKASVDYAGGLTMLGVAPLIVGVFAWIWFRRGPTR